MTSLIKKDVPHICDTVNNMDSYRVLRDQVNGLGYSPDARLMPYLELAGFESAALTRTFDLRRPETHTFYLPCGECTVTLEDVALHFGLSIDEDAVTGVSAIAEPATFCYSLLGASPGDADSTFSELKFTWLKANFQHLSVNATEEELVCAARAYIMHIIGDVLMPDSNNNKVHLQYLSLLADLRNVRSYSWGSAVLAMLYRELCRTTKPDAVDIGGCLVLLQSWALYRMPFLASVSHQPYVFLLVNRWSVYPGIGRSYTVPIYRLMIEQHAEEGVQRDGGGDIGRPEIAAIIPSSAYVDSQLWCSNAPIISFNVGEVHDINKRGKHEQYWGVTHRRFVAVWENRMARIPQMDISSDLRPSLEYIQWYSSMGKPYLLGGQSTIIPPHVQRSRAYELVADIEPDPQPDHSQIPSLTQSRRLSLSDRIHIRLILLIIRISRAMTIYRARHRIHIRPILLIIRIYRAMAIFRARQGVDIIMSLISLGHTHRSTALLPAYIHRIIALPPAPIRCSTQLLLGCIHRSMALLPAQVHRRYSS
ncbi:hypothetical protein CXB51_030968 [Gossypium anomalum]|uniref:Aminotransferase-like plant mobile domain-containing protein n=1 Tax=Gossypium anomalum TaxID=47600 RepID=A0A8J5Y577_9ROSI|nr:hypothetical protein CXB51_030968 [Gossypium anomalum]